MLDDLRTIGYNTPVDTLGDTISKELKSGTYCFNKDGGAVNGQMVTGKTTLKMVMGCTTSDGVKYEIQSNTKADAQWYTVSKYED